MTAKMHAPLSIAMKISYIRVPSITLAHDIGEQKKAREYEKKTSLNKNKPISC